MVTLGLQMNRRIPDIHDAVRRAVTELVSVRPWGDTEFVSLPMLFPGGTFTTVAISRTAKGFLVTDHGFAYRELEAIGAERSFGMASRSFFELEEIEKDTRQFFAHVEDVRDMPRAVMMVASASWRLVHKVYADKEEQEDEEEISDELQGKLVSLFGQGRVHFGAEAKLRGLSSTEWDVSAVVDHGDRKTVFQAVSTHPNSIYRTNSAFHDLAATRNPPRLIAVVRSLHDLGSRLSILSQAGRVIAENSPDEAYLRAAAA